MGWNWETLCREMVRHANLQAIGGPHSCPRHDSPEQEGQAQNRQVDSHRLDNKIGAGHGLAASSPRIDVADLASEYVWGILAFLPGAWRSRAR